jgi:peptide/nickel transport system substrate-binding protein
VVVVLKWPNSWAIGPHGLAGPYPSLITPRELQSGDQLEKVAVGSGAYHLERFDPTAELSFLRRPDGWIGERPYIDRVVNRVIADETARAAAFRARQIDQLTARDKLQADEFKSYGGDVVVDRELAFPRMLFLRADRPPFNDPRVRQAIFLTLDIKELIDRVDLGEGAYSGPVPPYLPAWALPEAELKAQFPVDRAKAQELLKAAGYDTSRELRHKLPNDPKSLVLAEVVQKQLGAIGIKTRLMPEDPNTVYVQTIANSDFDVTTAGTRVRGQDGNL